jgi:ribosomal protein L33
MIQNPTIKDFEILTTSEIDYIAWKEIERVLGKREYKKFCKWMNGQTCFKDGVYVCDVENYLRPEDKRFFD